MRLHKLPLGDCRYRSVIDQLPGSKTSRTLTLNFPANREKNREIFQSDVSAPFEQICSAFCLSETVNYHKVWFRANRHAFFFLPLEIVRQDLKLSIELAVPWTAIGCSIVQRHPSQFEVPALARITWSVRNGRVCGGPGAPIHRH
jgi:hypothetical protein